MFGGGGEFVKAFIYDKEGYYTIAITIGNEPLYIASFIVAIEDAPRILITNNNKNKKELDTIHGFIDTCADPKYLQEELLIVLIPMQ